MHTILSRAYESNAAFWIQPHLFLGVPHGCAETSLRAVLLGIVFGDCLGAPLQASDSLMFMEIA